MLVVAVAFGWFMGASVADFVSGLNADCPEPLVITSGHLYGVVLTELAFFPVLVTILYMRGWRLADFPMGIDKRHTLLGVLMAVGSYFAWWFVGLLFEGIFPSMRTAAGDAYRAASTQTDFVAVYILSVVNPVFEEVFVCGYVIRALSPRFGETTAINVSVAIRATYHLYQGIYALPYHLTYGLIQAYMFVRTRKLWPLIVSHGILDFIALL